MSGSCPEDVRKMSGRCPEDVRKMSRRCQEDVRKMSGRCPEDVRKMSGRCPEDVRKMSGRCPHLSSGSWAHSWQMQMKTHGKSCPMVANPCQPCEIHCKSWGMCENP